MLNKELLLGCDEAVIQYHGFLLKRHGSGMGTVITFKDWQGKPRDMLVLDAKYRSVLQFGAMGTTVGDLPRQLSTGASQQNYVVGNISVGKVPMPSTITNDSIYEEWGQCFLNENTASRNCDVWMKYDSKTDLKGIVGVPAVAWCRKVKVEGLVCNLPNIYEAIIIWACSDMLDEMDSTAPHYANLKLGYTSSGSSNRGRCQTFNNIDSVDLLSSTNSTMFPTDNIDYSSIRRVHFIGYLPNNFSRREYGTVAPILEL